MTAPLFRDLRFTSRPSRKKLVDVNDDLISNSDFQYSHSRERERETGLSILKTILMEDIFEERSNLSDKTLREKNRKSLLVKTVISE